MSFCRFTFLVCALAPTSVKAGEHRLRFYTFIRRCILTHQDFGGTVPVPVALRRPLPVNHLPPERGNYMTQGLEEQHAETGRKYFVNVEGRDYEWPRETITVPEIRNLGSLPPDQPVIEEQPDGSERQLREDEVVHLKPGHRYGRAPKYKRG